MRTLYAAILLCVWCGIVHAQGLPPDSHRAPTPTAGTQEEHTLAGPAVRERDHPTIVRRNLYGELQRPEEAPEEAAVRELNLGHEDRAAVEKVFLRRLRWIDRWVAGNAELLVRLKRVSDSTPLRKRVVLALEAARAVEPLGHEPSLWDQVREALPSGQVGDFDRVMTEYWDSLAADGRARAPGVFERFAIVSKERLAILGREIERSLATLGDSGHLAVTAITSALDLTEAQRSQLAIMAREYDDTVAMSPSGDQKRALVLKVLSILSPEQRERVLEIVGGG